MHRPAGAGGRTPADFDGSATLAARLPAQLRASDVRERRGPREPRAGGLPARDELAMARSRSLRERHGVSLSEHESVQISEFTRVQAGFRVY